MADLIRASDKPSLDWSQERVDLLKRTICKGSSDDELSLFLNICKRTKLDPFARQIYAIKRWDNSVKREVMGAQVSVDGLRLIAQRSQLYDGQEGPFFCGKDGIWHEAWLDDTVLPEAAKVTVHKKGASHGCTAVALFREYAQKKKDGSLTSMWKDKPAIMLGKCAESMALRKAFPQELSGLYSIEEYPPGAPIELIKPEDEIINFGKEYLGKRVGDLDPKVLWDYVDRLEQECKKANRPLYRGAVHLKNVLIAIDNENESGEVGIVGEKFERYSFEEAK